MSTKNEGVKRGKPGSTSLFKDGTYDIEEWHTEFLTQDDPTEYKAARSLLEDLFGIEFWKEWMRLKGQSAWFKRQVRLWKEELAVKQRSESFEKIQSVASSDKATAFQAAKWIAEGRYEESEKRGRPTAASLKAEAREIAAEASTTQEESQRVEAAIINLDDRRTE